MLHTRAEELLGKLSTSLYGTMYKGVPVFTETRIDIDTGAGLGLNPMLLRLEDMKKFYF